MTSFMQITEGYLKETVLLPRCDESGLDLKVQVCRCYIALFF